MPRLKIAHLREQGQDMIIVPLESSFGHKSEQDQRDTINELQMRARSAQLRGTVVPVWESGGTMKFIAPEPWHPFFRGLSMPAIWQNLNRELYW